MLQRRKHHPNFILAVVSNFYRQVALRNVLKMLAHNHQWRQNDFPQPDDGNGNQGQ